MVYFPTISFFGQPGGDVQVNGDECSFSADAFFCIIRVDEVSYVVLHFSLLNIVACIATAS